MRRTRRNILRLLGLLALLVPLLAGLAAAGWLPPFNRWVESRLLAELRVLGVETDATLLRELSWKRAVVGPVELELPGLTLHAAEARAALGWEVLARRGSPRVVLDGLVLEIDAGRLAELRNALQPQSGGFPYGRIEIERSHVRVREGDRMVDLPFTGFFDSMVEEFRAELVIDGEALGGRVSVVGDLVSDSVAVSVRSARAKPAEWSPLLVGLLPEAVAALHFSDDSSVQLEASGLLAEGRWQDVQIAAALPAFTWQQAGQEAEVGAGRLLVGAEKSESWRCELKAERAAWRMGDRSAALESPVVVLEPGSARVNFDEGRATVVGGELAGGGAITVRRSAGSGTLFTAEATLRLAEAGARGWALAHPAEVRLRWNGAELAVNIPALELAGEVRLQLASIEATAGGFSTGEPRLVASAEAGLDPGRWLGAERPGWRIEPATIAAKVNLSAVLNPGAEAVRAEIAVPAQRRAVRWAGGTAEAVLGGEAVLNSDRKYVSGRAMVNASTVGLHVGDLVLDSPETSFEVRWPRVWHRSLARWGGFAGARLVRDLLWTGDYECHVKGATLRDAQRWAATGVDFRWNSRGAELYETGGLDLGIVIGEISIGGERLTDWNVEATAGLEGGTLKAACSVVGLPFRPSVEQTLRWSDGFEAEGSFGFDPATLTGREPLRRWFPQLAGVELSGGLACSGRSRYVAGKWTLGADVVLQEITARQPAHQLAVEGVRGRLVFDSLVPLATAPEQKLAGRRGVFGGVAIDDIEATFAYSKAKGLEVGRLAGAGFGGWVECSAFGFDPDRPELATVLSFKGAKLDELLKLFDDVPAEASGLVDGTVPLSWREGRVGFGTGFLRLAVGELGRVHFTRDLHLLTNGRRPSSPEYASLRQVEQSIQNLVFNRLQIDLYPPDAAGQSLRVRLVGAPAGGEFAVPVSLDVNVNAPLEHFLNWGLGAAPAGSSR